ncbi:MULTISPECIES: hydroxymethylglutaryl-CoA reductase [Auritidibacter]|uniref:Hydroxymethylglutaryl-CoA reductase n=1 Tax=Auritidibacter ignavus TaxID=678932 RepID=A0AAJ6DBQ5_9MICC|nr:MULTISPECIES: hydroxymethylglutaryl-CoA reductase [Auritidibacter]PXA78390.1 hydroxymethylglutaryl-CoA reductase [Auritidibacter sp. NML100628]WGH90501.1 hydroxymethylglutaryl-CoA reductase [Auritidibacter ignavus]WGH92880.1 hydroxymethylglutaryl-CoA reductase [Auritidibacter ignavus]
MTTDSPLRDPGTSTYSQEFPTGVPTRWVGPIRIGGDGFTTTEMIDIPLATYETPLWPSVGRGAKISRLHETGLQATVHDQRMTRSILLTADSARTAQRAAEVIDARHQRLNELVTAGSRYAKLIEIHPEIVGNLLFVRLAYTTGDASGHNMVTAASDAVLSEILSWDLGLGYGSVSGNFCTDKKATAVNGVLGRGISVTVEMVIDRDVVEKNLRTTAEQLTQLVVQKNYVGSTIAGAIRSANAHFANMLLAFYLATGQDAANIVEGSQGFAYAENRDGDLYFSVSLPHLVVGTVGNGKHLPHVQQAMARMGLNEHRETGENSRRLAGLIAASVWCGELSLLAAQTNPGELMNTHRAFERNQQQR